MGSGANDPPIPASRPNEQRGRVRAQTGEPDAGPNDLDALMLDVVASAQRTWPTVNLPPDVFVAYVRDRLPTDVPPAVALRQMHVSDLYLVCACARGDVPALAAFDEHCLSQLDRVLGKMGIDADVTAEIKQDIRASVLVGAAGQAEIVDFSGRGDLRGWVRVMAVHRAFRRQCRARREVPAEDDELLQRLVVPGNPELDYAKKLYRQEFTQAFEGALRALPDRERTLLRQHYVDGLTIDELGKLYRMHRSTAARLVVRARGLVLEATRAQMMSRLEVHSQDLDSIIRMIRSQLDISLLGLRRGRRR
jgi:RNA polymerase sigma-70 factor (ECF subfamily)